MTCIMPAILYIVVLLVQSIGDGDVRTIVFWFV